MEDRPLNVQQAFASIWFIVNISLAVRASNALANTLGNIYHTLTHVYRWTNRIDTPTSILQFSTDQEQVYFSVSVANVCTKLEHIQNFDSGYKSHEK